MQTWQCPNGHTALITAAKCDLCGSPTPGGGSSSRGAEFFFYILGTLIGLYILRAFFWNAIGFVFLVVGLIIVGLLIAWGRALSPPR